MRNRSQHYSIYH